MRRNLLKEINIKKLNPAQKKALTISAVIALGFIVLWLFIYIPARNTVNKLKVELSSVDEQIKQIEERVSQARSLDEGIKLLETNLKNIKNRFPSAEEESIKALASFAQESGMSIDSMRPLPKKELLDVNGAPVKIKGRTCYVISVAIAMKCSFVDLVKYLEMGEKKLPAFAIIEKLNINSDPFNLQLLDVNMDLNLYLLSVN